MKSFLALAKDVAKGFIADDALSHAASISYYTALSFAPLVLLLLAIGGLFSDNTQNEMIHLFGQQLGPSAANITRDVVQTAEQSQEQDTAWWKWVFGTAVLLVTASGVFAQLQASLNRIWDVEAAPGKGGSAWWNWIRRRLLSIGMIFTLLFLLLVAMVLSAVLQAMTPQLEEGTAAISRIILAVSSWLVITLLFAAMFKVLPDAVIQWRDVWTGAAITALLFTIGKWLLGIYLTEGGVGDNYGQATGGLIVLLVWVYYSAIIALFGAEVTQHVARNRGREIEPKSHARRRQTAPLHSAAGRNR